MSATVARPPATAPAERSAPVPSTWLLLAVGAAWAVFGVLVLQVVAPHPMPLMPTRQVELTRSIQELAHGGPPLFATVNGHPHAVGASDDQGLFVIVPYLAHWLGASSPVDVLRGMYLAAWGLVLLFSPLVTWALVRSRVAALLIGFPLLVCILSLGFAQPYWVQAWAVLAFVPLLLLLARRLPRHGVVLLVALALLAGVLSAVRSGAGVPILIGAAVVVLAQRWRWWRAGLAIAALVVAYLALGSFGLDAVRSYRDDRVHADLTSNAPKSHPFWHSAYIGLGYTENDQGIHYADRYAIEAVQREAPGARYLGQRYDDTLRRLTLDIARDEPVYTAEVSAKKGVVALRLALPYLLLVALTLPWLLTVLSTRRERWRTAALVGPAVLIGFLPAVIAVPERAYETGMLAAIGFVALMGIAGLLAAVPRWTPRALLRLAGALITPRARRIGIAVLAASVLIVGAAHVFNNQHVRWDAKASISP